jgi:hypothetical protein
VHETSSTSIEPLESITHGNTSAPKRFCSLEHFGFQIFESQMLSLLAIRVVVAVRVAEKESKVKPREGKGGRCPQGQVNVYTIKPQLASSGHGVSGRCMAVPQPLVSIFIITAIFLVHTVI